MGYDLGMSGICDAKMDGGRAEVEGYPNATAEIDELFRCLTFTVGAEHVFNVVVRMRNANHKSLPGRFADVEVTPRHKTEEFFELLLYDVDLFRQNASSPRATRHPNTSETAYALGRFPLSRDSKLQSRYI